MSATIEAPHSCLRSSARPVSVSAGQIESFQRASETRPRTIGLGLAATAATAQDTCKSRGSLDTLYCDENGDLVADPPKDAAKLRNPSTLVFTYTPVEDPAVYANILAHNVLN